MSKDCEFCGATFLRPYKTSFGEWDKRQFCSNTCRARKRYQPNTPTTKPCEYCHAVMEKRPRTSRRSWDKRKFCDQDCWRGSQKLRWDLDLHDVRHLSRFGEHPDNISQRLGWLTPSLVSRLTEEGESELAEYMQYGPRESGGVREVKVIV